MTEYTRDHSASRYMGHEKSRGIWASKTDLALSSRKSTSPAQIPATTGSFAPIGRREGHGRAIRGTERGVSIPPKITCFTLSAHWSFVGVLRAVRS